MIASLRYPTRWSFRRNASSCSLLSHRDLAAVHSVLSDEQKDIIQFETGTLHVRGHRGTGKTLSAAARIMNLNTDTPHVIGIVPSVSSRDILQSCMDQYSMNNYSPILTVSQLAQEIAQHAGMKMKVLSFPAMCIWMERHRSELGLDDVLPISQQVVQKEKIIRDCLHLIMQRQAQDAASSSEERRTDDNPFEQVFSNYQNLTLEHSVIDRHGYLGHVVKLMETQLNLRQLDYPHLVIDDYAKMTPMMKKFVQIIGNAADVQSCVIFDREENKMNNADTHVAGLKNNDAQTQKQRTIQLNRNFRSNFHVQRLIQSFKNPDKADPKFPSSNFEMISFQDGNEEAQEISNRIQSHLQDHPDAKIIVYCPTNEDSRRLDFFLKQSRIAAFTQHEKHLFQEEGVKMMIAFFHLLIHPNESLYLYELLASPIFNFPPHLLAQIMGRTNPSRNHRERHFRSELEAFIVSNKDSQYEQAVEIARQCLQLLHKYSNQVTTLPAAELARQFLDETGLLQKWMHPESMEIERSSQALAQFFELLNEIGPENVPLPFLSTTLLRLGSYSLPFNFKEQDLSLQQSQASVSILVLKSSNFCEADVVFFASMRDSRFPGNFRRNILGHMAGEQHNPSFHQEPQTRQEHIDRMTSLVLDAMSSTRERVIISWAKQYQTSSGHATKFDAKLSRVFLPLWASIPFQSSSDTTSAKTYPKVAVVVHPNINFDAFPDPKESVPWMSYSQVDEYARCPYRYFLSRVMQVSNTRPSLHLIYGSVMHEGIAEASLCLMTEQQSEEGSSGSSSFALMIDRAAEAGQKAMHATWSRHHEAKDLEDFSSNQRVALVRQSEAGLDQFLQRHYQRQEHDDMRHRMIESVESPFRVYIREAKIELRGVFDRIERRQRDHEKEALLTIVEYKSNLSGRSRNVKDMATKSLQIPLYLLAQERLDPESTFDARLEIIETGQHQDVLRSDQMIQHAIEGLRNTTERIRAKEFQPTPSYFECSLCPYSSTCSHRY